jgi:hypothetical protein
MTLIKICVAIVGVSIAPLFVWLMVPTVMVLAAVTLFAVPLAALAVACTRPRKAIGESATTSTTRELAEPEPEPVSERRLRPSFFSEPPPASA